MLISPGKTGQTLRFLSLPHHCHFSSPRQPWRGVAHRALWPRGRTLMHGVLWSPKRFVFCPGTGSPAGHNAEVCNWWTYGHSLGLESRALLPGSQDHQPFVIISHLHDYISPPCSLPLQTPLRSSCWLPLSSSLDHLPCGERYWATLHRLHQLSPAKSPTSLSSIWVLFTPYRNHGDLGKAKTEDAPLPLYTVLLSCVFLQSWMQELPMRSLLSESEKRILRLTSILFNLSNTPLLSRAKPRKDKLKPTGLTTLLSLSPPLPP